MVRTNRTQKYMTRIGQYTGTSNACENVQKSAISVARVEDSLQECSAGVLAVQIHYAPELPFRQAADERPELVITSRRERCLLATTLDLVGEDVVLQRRVEFWLQERQQEVQQVYRMCVCKRVSTRSTIHREFTYSILVAGRRNVRAKRYLETITLTNIPLCTDSSD